jgi:hypothetical protein
MATSAKGSLRELCERMRKEEDLSKLLELVQEINRMLDERERQIKPKLAC